MFIFSFLVSYCLYRGPGKSLPQTTLEFILAGRFIFLGKTLQWCLLLCSDLFPSCACVCSSFEAAEFPSHPFLSVWDPRAVPSLLSPQWQGWGARVEMSLSPPALLPLSHPWELPAQHCSVQPKPFPGCHNRELTFPPPFSNNIWFFCCELYLVVETSPFTIEPPRRVVSGFLWEGEVFNDELPLVRLEWKTF